MLAKQFQENGLSLASIDDFADIYVINTCSVTENANVKCDRLVRKIKRINPDAFVVVTGCYAQLKSEELSKNDYIDLVVGSNDKLRIPEIINNRAELPVITSKIESVDTFNLSYSSGDRVRSFVKVQDGCDYNCTFCTIPLARGKSRSSSISEVVDLVNSLDQKGYKEVVLSGINLGDFGSGTDDDCYKLLKSIEELTSIPRIRISSIEPNLLTDKIISLISESDRFMPHLHIPLQSGSDRILKLMSRKYNSRFYSNKIKKIKSKIPNIAIGVDVIVGFPSETDDDFNETYKLLSDLEVSYLHVFTYSERENTTGISLPSKVPQEIRNKRSKRLRALSDYLKSQFIINNMSINHTVLIEGIDDKELHGYTENYIKVRVDSRGEEINDLVSVQPVKGSYDSIKGKVL
jgi:threonylcarbamoyladenosine tRNA methylthiotransferase MtaB